jgi:hypothetical protein
MPNRNIHLTSSLTPNRAGKLPTACGKTVAKRYASRFLEDAGCPGCLANGVAVAEAERLQVELRRARYAARLNCAGKAAAHDAEGSDLTDVDAGLRCGLIHVGACSREGDDFDPAAFLALDTRKRPDAMKFCPLCGVTVLHAGGSRCLSPNHSRNAERASA